MKCQICKQNVREDMEAWEAGFDREVCIPCIQKIVEDYFDLHEEELK